MRHPLILSVAVVLLACSGDSAGPNDPPDLGSVGLFTGVVSDPVGGESSTGTAGISPNVGGRVPMAWISMEPGSAPGATTGYVRSMKSMVASSS